MPVVTEQARNARLASAEARVIRPPTADAAMLDVDGDAWWERLSVAERVRLARGTRPTARDG
jgi:hypothetical protein